MKRLALFTYLFIYLFIYLSLFILKETETETAWVERAQRDRERETENPQVGSALAEPDAGLDLTNCEIMTWAETKSQMLNQLSHPGASKDFIYFFYLKKFF